MIKKYLSAKLASPLNWVALLITLPLSLIIARIAYQNAPPMKDIGVIGRPLLENINKNQDLYFVYSYWISFLLIYLLLPPIKLSFLNSLSFPKIRTAYEKVKKTLESGPGINVVFMFLLFSFLVSIRFIAGRFFNHNILSFESLTNENLQITFVLSLLGAWALNKFVKLEKSFGFLQIPIPLLFFALLFFQKNPHFNNLLDRNNFVFTLTATVLCLFAWYQIYKLKTNNALNSAPDEKITFMTFMALIVISRFPYFMEIQFPTDLYHFGESLLPYWDLKSFAGKLYSTHLPAHGLTDIAPAALGELLWGTFNVENVIISIYCIRLLCLVFAFSCLCLNLRAWQAFVIVLLIPPPLRDSYVLIIGLFSLLAWIWRKDNNALLFIVAPFILTLIAFFELAPGISIAAGFTPLLLYKLLQNAKLKQTQFYLSITIGLLMLFGFMALLPIDYIALIESLKLNSAANFAGYGTEWALSLNDTSSTNMKLEFMRSSFVWLLPVAIILAAGLFYNSKDHLQNKLLAFLLASFVIFCLVLNKYALGRIDPSTISRIGFVSYVGTLGLIPILLYLFAQQRKYVKASENRYFWIFLIVLFYFNFQRFTFLTFPGMLPVQWTVVADSSAHFFIKSDHPLYEKMGHLRIETAQEKYILSLKSLITDVNQMSPITFFDLTNQNSLYFYLDQKPPAPVSAFYNMAHPVQRLQVLTELKKKTNLLSLVHREPTAFHDGLTFWLRTPEIAEYILVTQKNRGIQEGSSGLILSSAASLDSFKGLKTVPSEDILKSIKVNTTPDNIRKIAPFMVEKL